MALEAQRLRLSGLTFDSETVGNLKFRGGVRLGTARGNYGKFINNHANHCLSMTWNDFSNFLIILYKSMRSRCFHNTLGQYPLLEHYQIRECAGPQQGWD
jgi:hypothetical protein